MRIALNYVSHGMDENEQLWLERKSCLNTRKTEWMERCKQDECERIEEQSKDRGCKRRHWRKAGNTMEDMRENKATALELWDHACQWWDWKKRLTAGLDDAQHNFANLKLKCSSTSKLINLLNQHRAYDTKTSTGSAYTYINVLLMQLCKDSLCIHVPHGGICSFSCMQKFQINPTTDEVYGMKICRIWMIHSFTLHHGTG